MICSIQIYSILSLTPYRNPPLLSLPLLPFLSECPEVEGRGVGEGTGMGKGVLFDLWLKGVISFPFRYVPLQNFARRGKVIILKWILFGTNGWERGRGMEGRARDDAMWFSNRRKFCIGFGFWAAFVVDDVYKNEDRLWSGGVLK